MLLDFARSFRSPVPGLGKAAATVLLLGAQALAFQDGDPFPTFVDVAGERGVTLRNVSGNTVKEFILESTGNGAAFLDYDRDGDMDLLIVNGSTLDEYADGGDPMVALYRNDGGAFVDVTQEAGMTHPGWGVGVCVGDYDNDAYPDAYVTAYGRNLLYRNLGNGTFEDVTSSTGTGDAHWGTNCAFADYDRDGHLDLYVANYLAFDEDAIPEPGAGPHCRYLGTDVFCGPSGLEAEPDVLYRNNGDGTFADATSDAGVGHQGYYGFGVLFTDFDNDGWPDIYVANDSVPNLLFRNNQNGTFSEVGLLSGTSLSGRGTMQAGMGVTAGDYDGDGWLDIFVTNFAQDTNTLYRNLGNLLFTDATTTAGLFGTSPRHLGWGTIFADFDNDGHLDLFVANGHVYPKIAETTDQRYRQPKEIYRNLGNGRFEEVTSLIGAAVSVPKPARGAAYGDVDNDGDIDVIVINIDEAPSLYLNDGGNRKRWITLSLEGTASNRDAIGARVEIKAGGRTQIRHVRSGESYLSHNDVRVQFGLGDATRIDRIRIRWPSGGTEEIEGVDADQFLKIREGQGVVEQALPVPSAGTTDRGL